VLNKAASERVRHLGPREDVVREGDKPTAIYLIREGWGCRYKTLSDGRRQIIALFLPGDLCDLNIFILRQMDHSIGTLTSVTLAEISRETFDDMIDQHSRVTQALWWESLVNIAIQREWTVNLGQRDGFERMSHLICELFFRLRSVGLTVDNGFDLPLTQMEIGDAVGLSVVHVNRVLQELRSANLITLNNRTLKIPDLGQLMQAAMFNPAYLHLDHEGRQFDAHE
jgi:CRP-like cAMP-binding protein